jgi:hypothetical protein
MSELADVALRFCNECLGWNGLQIHAVRSFCADAKPFITATTKPDGRSVREPFYYTDLNAVTDAVRGWSRHKAKSFSLNWVSVRRTANARREGRSPITMSRSEPLRGQSTGRRWRR